MIRNSLTMSGLLAGQQEHNFKRQCRDDDYVQRVNPLVSGLPEEGDNEIEEKNRDTMSNRIFNSPTKVELLGFN